MVKTYRPILHEFEAGAEVSQADVAVHVQQNVVGLDVPERTEKKDMESAKMEKSEEPFLQHKSGQISPITNNQ